MRVEIEIVVNGMVDPAAIFAAETEIDRRYAEMIEERRVVGTRPEGADAQVGAVAGLGAVAGVLSSRRTGQPSRLQAFPHRQTGFRILNIARHPVDKAFQRMRPFHL